jgi:lipid-A-disaccharide synthase
VLCLFPFEPELLLRHGIGATYVGHPLAGTIPMEPDKPAARAALGLGEHEDVVAILPGSRGSEVKYLAGRFFAAAARVKRERPNARFIVPAVPHLKDRILAAAATAGLGDALRVLDGQSHTALAACDVTLLASGTATLEAALFKRPMVVAYAMNWLTWAIHQRQHLQPWVALPNILAREFIVPELLQHDANPERLAGEVLDWFARPARMAAVQEKFRAQHELLRRDTAKLATDAIQEVVNR